MEVKHVIKSFQELNSMELYQILKLRNQVFIVEQNCVYQDIDNKDLESYHLMCIVNGDIAGYTRLIPPGVSYDDASIGRIVIGLSYRRLGLGRALVRKSIDGCGKFFTKSPIRISAQSYLCEFYTSLGFKKEGDLYEEDGILHIEMVRH